MDEQTVKAVREASVAAHEYLLQQGMASVPVLNCYRKGQAIGYVRLRPVEKGPDAMAAIEELGVLAAGAEADEVVVVWESQALAAATEQSADYAGTCLCLAHATRDGDTLVYRLPYRAHTAEEGTDFFRPFVQPEWLVEPEPELDPALPQPIDDAVHMSFAPWEGHPNPGLAAVCAHLERQYFLVSLVNA